MKWAHPKTCGSKRRNNRHEDEIAFDLEPQNSFFVHTPSVHKDVPNATRSNGCLIPDDAPIWAERRQGTRVYKVGEEPQKEEDE